MGCCGGGSHHSMTHGHQEQHEHHEHVETYGLHDERQSSSAPLELLKERLAKGEITVEEYQQILHVLHS